jgi:hypothetical protein
MSNATEENQEQRKESEQLRDTKQETRDSEESAATVVARPNSAVRDAATEDANSRQHATAQRSGASVPVRSKDSLSNKRRKKAAHRRRLRASSANG